MSVTSHVVYNGTLRCTAAHGPSGAAIITDAPTDNHGKGESFSPTDLVGVALGACIATIMGIVAQKNGYDIEGTSIKVVKDMITEPVRRIGALTVTVTMPSSKVFDTVARKKLEAGAMACPVKQSLHPDVALNIEFQWA